MALRKEFVNFADLKNWEIGDWEILDLISQFQNLKFQNKK